MYQQANETINQGLSLGARILLGSVAALFGLMMILIAEPPHKVDFIAIGVFCLLISLACVTRGRVRQFIGSCIGVAIFLAGVAYLVAELGGGVLWSGSRSQPSIGNAILYLILIGIPGAAYAYKARFGYRKEP